MPTTKKNSTDFVRLSDMLKERKADAVVNRPNSPRHNMAGTGPKRRRSPCPIARNMVSTKARVTDPISSTASMPSDPLSGSRLTNFQNETL